MDDENTQDPKPMVTFAFLPKEDSDNQKPDILDKIIDSNITSLNIERFS